MACACVLPIAISGSESNGNLIKVVTARLMVIGAHLKFNTFSTLTQ